MSSKAYQYYTLFSLTHYLFIDEANSCFQLAYIALRSKYTGLILPLWILLRNVGFFSASLLCLCLQCE